MQPSDFDQIDAKNGADRDNNSESEAKAKLEAELIEVKSRLKLERYCSALAIVIFFDVCVFRDFKNWGSPIAILILELICLILLAELFKIDHVPQLLDKILRVFQNRLNKR